MNSVSCHVELNISFLVLQLLFEAIRGPSWQGDIAIDDVSVGNCGGLQELVIAFKTRLL